MPAAAKCMEPVSPRLTFNKVRKKYHQTQTRHGVRPGGAAAQKYLDWKHADGGDAGRFAKCMDAVSQHARCTNAEINKASHYLVHDVTLCLPARLKLIRHK